MASSVVGKMGVSNTSNMQIRRHISHWPGLETKLEARTTLRLNPGEVEFFLMLCDSLKVHVQCYFDVLSEGVLGFGGVDGRRRKHRASWLA